MSRIFISWQQKDAGIAAQFVDRALRTQFGEGNVSLDRPIPTDERADARRFILTCHGVVVIIGPRWLAMAGEEVRTEVEVAITAHLPLFPVLVNGAEMPSADELPPSIQPLAALQTFTLADEWEDLKSELASLTSSIALRLGADRRRIFISYRRADASADAGRLYASLADELGEAALFMDVDDVPAGEDFRQAIATAIERSAALVLVIGPAWMAKDENGRLRLSLAGDPVRVEIQHARARGIPILPIRVRGAPMPGPHEFPDGLREWLPFVNAWEIEHHSWGRDLPPIVSRLRQLSTG